MMHRTVRKLADNTGFHMVIGQHPVGYCGSHPGHATELEARKCYAQYRRDNVIPFGTTSWSTCMIREPESCKNPANHSWQILGDGYSLAVLCDDHNTKEHAIAAMHLEGPAGDAWFS